MQAIINGVSVIGTPQEIAEYQRIIAAGEEMKKPPPYKLPSQDTIAPWWLINPTVTCDGIKAVQPKGSYMWNGLPDNCWR